MSQHAGDAARTGRPTMKPVTYTAQAPLSGSTLTCSRCGRVYPYPQAGGAPVRCECGWWYENRGGKIAETFKPRLGI
jgi:hypothetical protein